MKTPPIFKSLSSLPLLLFCWSSVFQSEAAAATLISLGSAAGFGILAQTAITAAGPSTIKGDAGTGSGTAISGQLSLTGVDHMGDAFTQNAHLDLIASYNDAANQPATTISLVPADLGGTTVFPGVYRGTSSLAITGTLTLNALGDPNAVFIFQAGSTLTSASGSAMTLLGGAQASNIFWQVGSSATLGTSSQLSGHILALTSITLTTGAVVDGGLYARNGAVTLDRSTAGIPEPSVLLMLAGCCAFPLLSRKR